MTSDTLKRIHQNYLNNSVSTTDIKTLIESYIRERKGVDVDINHRSIYSNPELSMNMMAYAFDYYFQKFDVAYIIKQ